MTTFNNEYKKETFRIPSWALCYIFNGDTEGITEQEAKDIDSFISRNRIECFSCPADEQGIYFACSNDINNEGADCQDIEALVRPQPGEGFPQK